MLPSYSVRVTTMSVFLTDSWHRVQADGHEGVIASLFSMNRNLPLFLLLITCLGLLSSPAVAAPPLWIAGGAKQGGKVRKHEPLSDPVSLSWVESKAWGVERDGSLSCLRPGKDEGEEGTDYYFVLGQQEVGSIGGKKVVRLDLGVGEQDKTVRALLLLVEVDVEGEQDAYAIFFHLTVGKGMTVTTQADGEKKQLQVQMLAPKGKGTPRTYTFAFPEGTPVLKGL